MVPKVVMGTYILEEASSCQSDHIVCEEDAYSDFGCRTTRVIREFFESLGHGV